MDTFRGSKLDHAERDRHREIYNLHVDLLRLRRDDPALGNWAAIRYDGAVLSDDAFCLRVFGAEHGDRLLLFNLGMDLHLNPAPEPLLAPPFRMHWEVAFSTEHPKYGGYGTAPLDTEENWRIPGRAAVILNAAAGSPEKRGKRK